MKRGGFLQRKTPLRAKSAWQPKRTYIKVGKVGRANTAARKEIARVSEEKSLTRCELNLSGCMQTWPLAPAHRHKRAFYKGDAVLLADPKQWVCACQVCHDQIEHDADRTEQLFLQLRGEE